MKIKNNILLILFCLIYISCTREYTPKPDAYFRIALKNYPYNKYSDSEKFEFSYADNSNIEIKKNNNKEEWLNINYPKYKATLHLSYKAIDGNLESLLEDSRTFVYKHTVKADAIVEQVFSNKKENTYGIIYYLEGNTASCTQFIATDSSNHFLRGALYFNVHPNKDSISPVIKYLNKDIKQLMETLKWK